MVDHQGLPFSQTGLARTVETNQRLSLTETINVSTTDPSHLFWVPASFHPEIAPTEFEKHVQALRINAMNDEKSRRRRSALSFSFTATEDDLQQDSNTPLATSDRHGQHGDNHQTDSHYSDKISAHDIDQQDGDIPAQQQQQAILSLTRSNSLQSLTGSDEDDDLQAKETSPNHNEPSNKDMKNQHIKLPAKSRKGRVRRSMSLQLPDNTTDPGNIPDFLVFDRNSAILDQSPVLVSKANRPLSRRGARTKFRKTSALTLAPLKSMDVPPLPTNWSAEECLTIPSSSTTDNDTTKDTEDQQHQHHDHEPEMDVGVTSTFATVTPIQHCPTTNDVDLNLSAQGPTDQPPPLQQPTTRIKANTRPLSELPVTLQHHTEDSPPRERKSSWSWSFWANDKKVKNDKAMDPAGQEDNSTDTKESNDTTAPTAMEPVATLSSKQRFGLSSLFSRKTSTPNTSLKNDKEKPINAAIPVNMPPKDFQLNKMHQQRRLPIHTERAMYRLSHTKLANSRRPLRDQVVISNFMFWYLHEIQQQQQQQNQPLVSFSQESDSNSPPPPSRHNMPRTPQQIIMASRKKKRQTKKNHRSTQQKPATKSTSSNQKKRTSSLTASSQLQHIDRSSKNQASTGFVVPDDYLRPAAAPSDKSDSSGINLKQQRQSGYARSNNWSSDSEEDDDDESDDDDDDSDDDDSCIGKVRHDKALAHSSGSERIPSKQLHTTQRKISQQHNHHPYNQHQRQQPGQHPQHYLISASAI